MKPLFEYIQRNNFLVGILIAAAISLSGFYYTTTTALAQTNKDIFEVKKLVDKIDATPMLNAVKIQSLEKGADEQKSEIKELRNEVREFIKQYNEDQKELRRLLK